MSVSAEVREALDSMKPGDYLRAADIQGSPGAVATALSRACSGRPDIVRIRKGLYWKGVASRFGAGAPSPLEAAVVAAGKGAGPAGWSALSMLGLTTQVPSEISIAVPGRQLTSRVSKVHKRSNVDRVRLTPVEVAVLEALRDEWFERSHKDLPGRVAQLAESGVIDLARLSEVARSEPSPRVRERAATLMTPA